MRSGTRIGVWRPNLTPIRVALRRSFDWCKKLTTHSRIPIDVTATTPFRATHSAGKRRRPTSGAQNLNRAQRSYVSYADLCNRAISATWDAVPSRGPTWDEYPHLYAVSAEANRRFAQALRGYEWPSYVRDAANLLVDAVAEEAGRFFQASVLPGTKAALASVLSEIQEIGDRAAEAAQAMRKALDLPYDA